VHDEGRELVLCGDINIARADIDVHPKERKPGVIGQREESVSCSISFWRQLRRCRPRARIPTTPTVHVVAAVAQHAQRNIGWRIDYILASTRIAVARPSCEVLADIGTSDHAPVMMTIT
jgi:exodeoxyribonuclease-3